MLTNEVAAGSEEPFPSSQTGTLAPVLALFRSASEQASKACSVDARRQMTKLLTNGKDALREDGLAVDSQFKPSSEVDHEVGEKTLAVAGKVRELMPQFDEAA